MVNISNIRSKLIAVSCLKNEENERVMKWWRKRFNPRDTFYVKCNVNDNVREIYNSIRERIQEANAQNVQNANIIVAYFLDFTEKIDKDWMRNLWALNTLIRNNLHCRIDLMLEFGYVGRQSNFEENIQQSNVREAVALNCNNDQNAFTKRLCLVSTPEIDDGTELNWKVICILLDILRRQTNPNDILPHTQDGNQNNDVGFLRYAEVNEQEHQKLECQKREYESLLGNDGSMELVEYINNKLSEKFDKLKETIEIDGGKFVTANMSVTNSCFNIERKKAIKGTNKTFNKAKKEAEEKILREASEIKQKIENLGKQEIENASDVLDDLLKIQTVGVGLKKDRMQMRTVIRRSSIDHLKKPELNIKYDENGYNCVINKYLSDIMEDAIVAQKNAFVEELVEIYDRDYRDYNFNREAKDYQDKLDDINIMLDSIMTEGTLISSMIRGNPVLRGDFHPAIANGQNRQYLLCETRRSSNNVNRVAANATSFSSYEIDETNGGVPESDNCPLKALQIVFLDAEDAAINQLLPVVHI